MVRQKLKTSDHNVGRRLGSPLQIAPIVHASTPIPENRYGLPAWDDRSQYPSPENLTLAQWRWEFLRRTKHYRELWEEHEIIAAKPGALEGRVGTYRLGTLIDPSLNASRVDIALLRYQKHLIFQCKFTFTEHDEDYSEKFEDFIVAAEVQHSILAAISPRRPLAPQFATIERLIKANPPAKRSALSESLRGKVQRTPPPRMRTDKFPVYLRLLDARDQSLPHRSTWSEIVRTFSAEKHDFDITLDNLRRMYRQAISAGEALSYRGMVE
jgi:hypothetical protein